MRLSAAEEVQVDGRERPFGPPRNRPEEKRDVRGYLMLAAFAGVVAFIIAIVSGHWGILGIMVLPLLFALYYAIPLSEEEERHRR
jgi:fatty acid desaturase